MSDNSNNKKDFLLSEYSSLKSELQRRQNARIQVLGFTLAAIGTILGLIADKLAEQEVANYWIFIFVLVGLAFIIIIAASILTFHQTKHIELIGEYIHKNIEEGLFNVKGWESHWHSVREKRKKSKTSKELPKATNKPLALFYLLLSVAVFCMILASKISLKNNVILYLTIILLFVVSLIFIIRLYLSLPKWTIEVDSLNN